MKNESLLKALADCIAACNHCAGACLKEENLEMMVRCIRTDLACAAICTTAHSVVAGDFLDNYGNLLQTCAEICDECANECEKHDHEHCQKCAEACRKCAEACRAAA